MEDDPTLKLNIEGKPFESNRTNTTIFTFVGQLAMFNHVFVQTGEDENNMVGAYVFCDNPAFQPITEHASTNSWPMILNRNEVPECDVNVWERSHLEDIRSFESYPEDWDKPDAA